MQYVVIFEKGEESYGAYLPDLPGCVAVGETLDEVRTLIVEAIQLHIEALQAEGTAVPPPTSIPVLMDIELRVFHKSLNVAGETRSDARVASEGPALR